MFLWYMNSIFIAFYIEKTDIDAISADIRIQM